MNKFTLFDVDDLLHAMIDRKWHGGLVRTAPTLICVSNGASSPPLMLVVRPNTKETPEPVKGLWKLLAVLLDGRTWLGVLLIKYYILQSRWEG